MTPLTDSCKSFSKRRREPDTKAAASGLFDPATNIKYGAAFLAGLLKKYPDVLDAIAAYNMG